MSREGKLDLNALQQRVCISGGREKKTIWRGSLFQSIEAIEDARAAGGFKTHCQCHDSSYRGTSVLKTTKFAGEHFIRVVYLAI